jgi:putative ABC transport system permease protein
MLRNYIVVALRNIARNPLYAAISVFGLAVGLCAALVAAIVIHAEYHYDQFVPGFERTYLIVHVGSRPGMSRFYSDTTSSRAARSLQLYAQGVEAVARESWESDLYLRRGSTESKEPGAWVDPAFFRVLPLPVLYGNLSRALERPDGIVLTRGLARKYFGRENVVGQTVTLDRVHELVVTAVIEDLPESQFRGKAFLSGAASFSSLTSNDQAAWNTEEAQFMLDSVRTYVRLSPDASALARFKQSLSHVAQHTWPQRPEGVLFELEALRLDEVHAFGPLNPGLRAQALLTGIIAALILLVSCINFVNLITARSVTRAKEVAVRKTAGASRSALVVQFVGESFVYVALATALGLALTEWLLPYVSALFDSTISTSWWREPQLLAWAAAGLVLLAIVVGLYPGFVLSSFRPVGVFKGGANGDTRLANQVRQLLVTLQFAVLIGLMIVAGVVWQQREFATSEALRLNTDQMLIVRAPCQGALMDALRSLPGVRSASCSGETLLGKLTRVGDVSRPGGENVQINYIATDHRALEAYDIHAIAGTLHPRESASKEDAPELPWSGYAINESARHKLGFRTPDAAIGQSLRASHLTLSAAGVDTTIEEKPIVAVVPDFSFSSVERAIPATVYYAPAQDEKALIHLRLTGVSIPETLKGIDRAWREHGDNRPIDRFFASEHVQSLYASMLRLARAFSVFCGVALLLACLGLVGLASSIAERRTREIGVRKAMGAGNADIVRLLLWQFGKPVLWANLIAWPVAGYLMHRWLQGFAYHTSLNPVLFIGAAAVTLVIALVTVSAHSMHVARARPVTALRYE